MELKKIVFIVNPVSGLGRRKDIHTLAGEALGAMGCELLFQSTNGPGHAKELSAAAVKEGADVVVAVGGDGTVNEVASALVATKVILGIIPSGSGNGLARHLKIPRDTRRALEVINNMNVAKMDTATLNGNLFVSIAGVGFDAWVAHQFAEKKKRGFLSYLSIVMKGYSSYKPKRYKIFLDGKRLKRRALFISFANSDQFGYGTSIAPDARVDDGLIDVCLVGKPKMYKAPFLAYLLFRGQASRIKQIESYKAAKIRIEGKSPMEINLDGESLIVEQNLEIIVNPVSLQVLIP